jgi:hypothetical protein
MRQAGIKLDDLARDRDAPYRGTAIAQLPGLTAEQKRMIQEELVTLAVPPTADIGFGPGMARGFLREQDELSTASLALPRPQQIRLASASSHAEKRVTRVWNRYGYLLLQVAGRLEIDPAVAVAVVAAQADGRGLARDGRLALRFEVNAFYDRWGKENPKAFQRHFRFDPARPWQKHQWRPGSADAWRDCHGTQDDEWGAFDLACTLDEAAAKRSASMGLARMMGFARPAIGYESVGQMFDAFSSSERYQLLAVFDLIAGPLADSRQVHALRKQDFEGFAALHFGGSQAARYGSTMRGLFDAFQRLNSGG